MSTKPWKLSKADRLDQYRSISQHTRYGKGVQGGARPPRHARPGRWIRLGLTPPQLFGTGDIPSEEYVCPKCGEPYQGESGEWEGDVLIFRHESGNCRMGGHDE